MPEVVDMLDAIGANARTIPAGTKRVAIYLTGSGGIAWTNDDVAALTKDDPQLQRIYRIDQANDPRRTYLSVPTLVVDIEPGAASLSTAIEIARVRAAHGLRTTLYYFEAEQTAVRNAVAAAGLEAHIDYWLAWWTNDRAFAISLLGKNGVVAVQWRSAHFVDYSVTLADWPAPLPTPDRKGPAGTFKAEVSLDEKLAWDATGTHSEGVVLGGPDVWDEAKIGVNRATGHWRIGPLPLERRLSKLQIHPKVAAVTGVAAPLVAVRGVLSAFGVHVPLTGTEQDAIVAVLPILAGYLKSSGVKV